MVEIKIYISINTSDKEKEKLSIPREDMDEFLRTGFAENAYEGEVSFNCQPRAINPEYMQIIIDLKDLAESLIAWGTIITSLIKFCKKCKGYEPDLVIKRKRGEEEIEIYVKFDSNEDPNKLLKKIKKALK